MVHHYDDMLWLGLNSGQVHITERVNNQSTVIQINRICVQNVQVDNSNKIILTSNNDFKPFVSLQN